MICRVLVVDSSFRCCSEVPVGEADSHGFIPVEVVEVACPLGLPDEIEPLRAVFVVDDRPVG